jgi:cytochrome c-type biogenesis protein CcmH/NrfF
MKVIVLLALGIIVASLAVAGCETTNRDQSPSPASTFAPFHLRQGQVTIYVGGMEGEFPVFIDSLDVGVVSKNRPLTLMTDEGIRSVEVCCGITCERENVTVTFGKPRTIDFSEQLKRDCEFSEPAVRVIDYFLSGDQLTVTVELVNPTTRTVTLSAEVRCWYSYIESQSNNRVAHDAGGQVVSTLTPGTSTTQVLRFRLAKGSGYMYEMPTISRFSAE